MIVYYLHIFTLSHFHIFTFSNYLIFKFTNYQIIKLFTEAGSIRLLPLCFAGIYFIYAVGIPRGGRLHILG